eukprot:1482819-Heterocapsa_arctica.AAC.1
MPCPDGIEHSRASPSGAKLRPRGAALPMWHLCSVKLRHRAPSFAIGRRPSVKLRHRAPSFAIGRRPSSFAFGRQA